MMTGFTGTLWRCFSVALLMAALATGCSRRAGPLTRVWLMPLAKPTAVAASPDGGVTVAALAEGGAIAIDSSPKTLWERDQGAVSRIAVGKNGETLLLERLAGGDFRIVWLDIDGGVLWSKPASPDTQFAFRPEAGGVVALDGMGILFASRSSEGKVVLRRVRQSGKPVSLVASGATGELLCVFSAPNQIALFSADGIVTWRKALSAAPECLAVSANFARAAVIARGEIRQLSCWDAGGQMLWQTESSGQCERLILSPEGGMTLVQCAVPLPGKSPKASSSRLALFDSGGRRIFEKGGVLINPQVLMAAAEAGAILCWDAREGFVVYDNRGREIWHGKPEPISLAWSPPNTDIVFTWRESALTCWRATLARAR